MDESDREIVAEFIVSKPILKQFVDTLTPLVRECRINLSEDGFRVDVVDPANVASILPVKLKASGFENIDAPGSASQGLNLKRLDDYIGKARNDDLIHVRLDMASRKLLIDYREIHHSMALIDPDSVRAEPDLPKLDLPNTVGVSGASLSEAVGVADLVSDHIQITAGNDKESVIFSAEGDTDDADYTISGDSLVTNEISDADAETLLSLEYLKELVKPMPDDAEIQIRFGTEFPIIMDWSANEDCIEVKQLLAPRIQSD